MKILDGIGKGLNIVGKKTSEMASTAKLKLDITKHRTTIDKKYTEIGARYYFLRQENLESDEIIETLIEDVRELYEIIDALEKEVVLIQGQEEQPNVCRNCENPLADHVKFCSECGVETNTTVKVCSRCNSPVGESSFCSECGMSLD